MPGRDHERLVGEITGYLTHQIHQMGLQEALENLGATRITPVNQGGACKESDSTYPPRLSRQMGQSPSLAIEVGVKQSLQDLRGAKDWWFDMTPPGEGVNLVLLIKCFSRHLRIECWIRGNPEPNLVEVRLDSWSGSPLDGTTPAWIATGPMDLPFEPVMIRPKEAGERDFVLEEEFLSKLAQKVLT